MFMFSLHMIAQDLPTTLAVTKSSTSTNASFRTFYNVGKKENHQYLRSLFFKIEITLLIPMLSVLVFLVSTKRRTKLITEFTVVTSRGYVLGFYVVIDIVMLASITTHRTSPALARLCHQPSYLRILKYRQNRYGTKIQRGLHSFHFWNTYFCDYLKI